MISKASRLAIGTLTCLSLVLPPAAAEAGHRGFGWRSHHVGWHAGPGWGYRHHYAFHRPWGYGGYHPAVYGGYYPYHGYPIYYRRRSNAGAAIAAGLIGGIALGAIIANASRPHHVYHRPHRVYRHR